MFEPKAVQRRQLLPLAAAYVAYIVLCNLNLNINPVGFYQITKIAGAARGGAHCQGVPAAGRIRCRAVGEAAHSGAAGRALVCRCCLLPRTTPARVLTWRPRFSRASCSRSRGAGH